MNGRMSLKKQGKFYVAYDGDAYVLHALFGYKVVKGRAGFPLEVLGKVTSGLEINRVNYVVLAKNEEVERRKFSPNRYGELAEKGKQMLEMSEERVDLLRKVKMMNEEPSPKASFNS